MLIHHGCGFPEWIIVPGIDYSKTTLIYGANAKMCVAIYAFLTAYAFFLHKDKSHLYVFGKILNFLLNYWIVLFFIAFIACTVNQSDSVGQLLLRALFPIRIHSYDLMVFAWYVVFYALIMLALPYINLGENRKKKWGGVFYPIIFCLILSLVFKAANITGAGFFFSVILGHLCAKFDILNRISTFFNKKGNTSRILGGVTTFCIFFAGFSHFWGDHHVNLVSIVLQSLIIPFIITITLLYPLFIKFRLTYMFSYLGKHSLNIWFLHCIFFSGQTRSFFQPIAYWSKSPMLAVLTMLSICIILSFFLTKIQHFVLSYIKKALLQPMTTPSE